MLAKLLCPNRIRPEAGGGVADVAEASDNDAFLRFDLQKVVWAVHLCFLLLDELWYFRANGLQIA